MRPWRPNVCAGVPCSVQHTVQRNVWGGVFARSISGCRFGGAGKDDGEVIALEMVWNDVNDMSGLDKVRPGAPVYCEYAMKRK